MYPIAKLMNSFLLCQTANTVPITVLAVMVPCKYMLQLPMNHRADVMVGLNWNMSASMYNTNIANTGVNSVFVLCRNGRTAIKGHAVHTHKSIKANDDDCGECYGSHTHVTQHGDVAVC